MSRAVTESERVLEPIDLALGEAVDALAVQPHPAVRLAAAVASWRMREGNVCVDLGALSQEPGIAERVGVELVPSFAEWSPLLRASGVVGDGSEPTPLVLEEQRLYLYRNWLAEKEVAAELRARGMRECELTDEARTLEVLDEAFGERSLETDWQRAAAATALLGNLTILVGGPGTGKTSTVVRLLAALQRMSLAERGQRARVRLLAPTGKAAARLVESVTKAKQSLSLEPEVAAGIPEEASTLHRALYRGRRLDVLGRYESIEPLFADLVVVDETSMVDLALLHALLQAVPSHARLVLLGDDEQLASVEAGSALGDLTRRVRGRGYSVARAGTLDRLGCGAVAVANEATPLRDQIIELSHSYRFDAKSGIGAIVQALRAGDAERVFEALEEQSFADVRWVQTDDGVALGSELDEVVAEGYTPFLRASSPAEALAAFEAFRVLGVHRRGARGVEGLTERIEGVLRDRAREQRAPKLRARPIMITENHYQLGLYNGDVGVVWRGEGGAAIAHFPSSEPATRTWALPRLPAHETAFALTVHKSQGSEFDEVAIVLPHAGSPLLTREMLYTAVSRARRRVTLWGSREGIAAAVAKRVTRSSGLEGEVWKE